MISTQENCMKPVIVHIHEQNLNISESKFKQVMYNHNYKREACEWKLFLKSEHRVNRVVFTVKNKDFNWVKWAISSNEAKMKTVKHYIKKVWRKSEEKLSSNVIK